MRLIRLMIAICAILSVSVFAYAHPGKTDSNGGHINHSTGEYHYHHGYSAHQHYDQNGDGILDCQHLFIDKTDSSSDTQNGKNTSNQVEAENKKVNQKLKAIKDDWIPIICCFLLYGLILLVDKLKWIFRK